jgi:penicillin-insensitive murein DD-endopeptidase
VLRFAAEQPDVERIFMHPLIKQELCLESRGSNSPNSSGWLQKIRPWYGHDDHFHVRLRCPEGAVQCQHQDPVPPGDGCDLDLAWWFSPEGRDKQRQSDASGGPEGGTGGGVMPTLPASCAGLIPS